MKIPKRFKLGGCTWLVRIDNSLVGRLNQLGRCEYNRCEILLKDNDDGVKFHDEMIWRIFYHELVHAILFPLSELEFDFNNDKHEEFFVENFSHRLHQAISTFEGDLLNSELE